VKGEQESRVKQSRRKRMFMRNSLPWRAYPDFCVSVILRA
jgi:hypothetical protein